MRIRYVVSSMIFWGREHPLSLESECELLKSLGFGIELWPNIKGQHECRYVRRNWHRLAAATEGMLVAMRSRHDSPTLEQWSEQIECAKLLGAHIVTDFRSMGFPDEPELNGCDFAAKVVKCAEEKGITLCLETGSALGKGILKEISKRFESIRYCLDTSHAHSNGSIFGGFKPYIDELGPKVVHLHLNDNFTGRSTVGRPPARDASRRSREIPDTRFSSIESDRFGFPGGNSAYQGLCRFWCGGGGMPREDWDYLLETLSQNDNDIVGSIEMSPCMPSVMIRQASEFLFDILKWPNRPEVQSDHAEVGYHPM